MVVANVCREPRHDRAGPHETRGLHSGDLICPAGAVVEGNPGEIVLRVEKIRTDRTGNEVRNDHCQQKRGPSEEPHQYRANDNMQTDGNHPVVVLARLIEEWIDTHSVEKDEHISKQNRQRMTHELVLEPAAR